MKYRREDWRKKVKAKKIKLILASVVIIALLAAIAGAVILSDKGRSSGLSGTEDREESRKETDTWAGQETTDKESVTKETGEEKTTEAETQEEKTTEQQTQELETEEPKTEEPASNEKESVINNGKTSVTLSFVGDVYVSPMMYNNYQARGISGVISENIQSIFNSVDIAAADHEYVCGDLDESLKVNYQQYTFLTPTVRESILKDFSFDVMTLANNHTMDYGQEGIVSTMRAVREQGIAVIGAGNNLKEALTPYSATVNGKKIAILSATRVVPHTDWYAGQNRAGLLTTYEQTDRFQMIKDEITRLKNQEGYDIVIMYVHWGNDSDKTILDSQVQLGHGYIDAGADIVIGNHTHVLQGMEMYNGKLICYGLSNFLFGSYHSDTMVLTLEIKEDNSIAAKMVPCSSEGFYTRELTGEAAQDMFRYVESMSGNITISEEGWIREKNTQ